MKQLELNGRTISIPSDVWEMTLGQFLDTMEVIAEGNLDELSRQARLVSLVTGIPQEEIDNLDYNHFVQLAEIATLDEIKLPQVVTPDEIGLNESKQPIRFSVQDEHGTSHEFLFQPDAAMSKLKHIARVEDFLKGRDLMKDLHIVLALAAAKEHEEFDPEALDKKAQLMCRAKMVDVYRPLFFFALQGRSSLLFTRLFSKAGSQKESVSMPS